MPRIPPWLFRQANKSSPDLTTLLPACRDLASARNELRWIRNHVNETAQTGTSDLVRSLCQRRGRGEPLQYVLGSQPFGNLDIKCRPGVLIPRSETEAYTCYLVELLKSGALLGHKLQNRHDDLNIVDFCSGTGCIPLLLFSSLQRWVKSVNVRGFDVSPKAIQLAKENIAHNLRTGQLCEPSNGQSLEILRGDIFTDEDIQRLTHCHWDLMVSNPPYISRDVWNHGRGQLGSSVRKFEPRLALVPNDLSDVPLGWVLEDVFYSKLLDLAARLRPKAILLEIGDEGQARRVLAHLYQTSIVKKSNIEVWRDWPDIEPVGDEEGSLRVATLGGQDGVVPIRGSGRIRAVVVRPQV